MTGKLEKDEHLEKLWYMREEGSDSVQALKDAMGAGYNPDVIDELVSEGLAEFSRENDAVVLTEKGREHGRRIIRAHRLAERLLYDVLGGDYESGACEFEHTVTPELVDSICILLGHPRECPHGMPIPEGECCRRSSRTTESPVVPLVELEVGQSARVAYINCRSDQRLHKMDSLRIRPGALVTLHQRYPSCVLECEGSNIAMDDEIVASIRVWREPNHLQAAGQGPPGGPGARRRRRWGGFRRRRGPSA